MAALEAAGARLCVFHRWTGLPCLTCGSTRACAALAAGDLAGSFRVQPLVSALLTIGIAVSAAFSLMLVGGRAITLRLSADERRLTLIAAAVLAAVNWMYLLWRGV